MSIKIVGSGIERVNDNVGRLTCERGILNVIDEDEYIKVVIDVLTDIADVVGQTLGPFGHNILLTEPYGASPVFPSKDGFRIMLNEKYDNPIHDTVYRIVRDISARTNEKVGDGTTSGNIIAADFVKGMFDFIKKSDKGSRRITPAGVKNILKVAEEVLTEILKESYIKPVSGTEIPKEKISEIYKKVATIAANNDPVIAEIVTDVFKQFGDDSEAFVDVERAYGDKTYADTDMGFEVPFGFLHRSMVTEADGMTCKFTDPVFLMIDGPLLKNDLNRFSEWVFRVCVDLKKPMVVIAAQYAQEVTNWIIGARAGIKMNDANGSLYQVPIVTLQIDSYSEIGNNRLLDIQTAVGGIALPTKDGQILEVGDAKNPLSIMPYLGRADTFKSQMYNSRIIGGKGEKSKIDARIEELRRDLNAKSLQDSIGFQTHIAMLKKRIGMLKSRMTTIYAGGLTYKEKESQRLMIEDAVCAVRSTIENGFTLGGNVSISHAILNKKDIIVKKITDLLIDRKLNVCAGNKRETIEIAVDEILSIIQTSSIAAYKLVLKHAGFTDEEVQKQLSGCIDNSDIRTLNLMTMEYENLDYNSNLLVAGNTDFEILGAVIAVACTFLTSNRMMTMYHPGQR